MITFAKNLIKLLLYLIIRMPLRFFILVLISLDDLYYYGFRNNWNNVKSRFSIEYSGVKFHIRKFKSSIKK